MSVEYRAVTFYEYGYRTEAGVELWESDHGTDGSWIPYNRECEIRVVDIRRDGKDVDCIYEALDEAGVQGVALRREVVITTGVAEIVTRDTP